MIQHPSTVQTPKEALKDALKSARCSEKTAAAERQKAIAAIQVLRGKGENLC